MTAILLCFFSPITKTDIPTSEYSSAYLYTSFEHFMLTKCYCLEEPVAAAPLFCDQLVITTVTLPVTCHIGLREATFSHENMPVSIRKKYHKTWGALGSDKKLA